MENQRKVAHHTFGLFPGKSPNQSSDILQHSQNRPTGDRWLKL